MIRKLAISSAILLAAANFVACNSDVESTTTVSASSAIITSFSLTEDDDVLENLDSVFFSIDLAKGLIYNADSLPYGTDVTKLIPVISTMDGASLLELTVKRSGGSDTVYDYLTNSTDSIDFTNPVALRMISPDGATELNYTVNVNVHKMKPDSLTWSQVDRRELPSAFATPAEQRTTRSLDRLYCLTRYQSGYCISQSPADLGSLNDPDATMENWTNITPTFGFTPDVTTFTATDDALYILSTDGTLYKSADGGSSWSSTGEALNNIIGGYGTELLGNALVGSTWEIHSYPSGNVQALPQGMPVSGMSVPVCYKFALSPDPQLIFTGGRKADGTLSNATWGFDGSSWIQISKTGLPEGLEGVALIPYFTFNVSTSWNVTEYPTILAVGGRKADGSLNTTVYRSSDYGYIWSEADDLLQMPDFIPAMYDSQAYVIISVLQAPVAVTKVSKPIENWDCPYIYLFGGRKADGTLYNTVWRGVINRLSFKPIV